jgi:adenine-specific DNA-methyltransferase
MTEVGLNTEGAKAIKQIFGEAVFPYSKPKSLIEFLASQIMDDGDIMLDSFAGSGTTAHAILSMNHKDHKNRKFIIIEMLDYAENITAERIRRVISGHDTEETGGGFSFYELGEQLLLSNGELNPKISDEVIREYIWYMETRCAYVESYVDDNTSFLGLHNDTAYYFVYESDKLTVLDNDFLRTIKTKADAYVIYADTCNLSDEKMSKYNITLKKIPRDIARL